VRRTSPSTGGCKAIFVALNVVLASPRPTGSSRDASRKRGGTTQAIVVCGSCRPGGGVMLSESFIDAIARRNVEGPSRCRLAGREGPAAESVLAQASSQALSGSEDSNRSASARVLPLCRIPVW
jgi:hypothetical protein